MRRIYGLGNFEHVNYRFLEEPGKRVLVVDAVEKSWGLDTLRFGLGLSSDFSGDAYFNVIGSYRKTLDQLARRGVAQPICRSGAPTAS